MTPLRRFLVLQALLPWQGGFLFYTSVVVPTGTHVLGSAAAQGTITARVTESLNALGVVCLAVFAWELAAARDPNRRRAAGRWACWAVAVACQCVLFVFHDILASYMDADRRVVVNRPPFYPAHRTYLWAATVQWAAVLVLSWWTLRAWAAEATAERRSPAEAPPAADSTPAEPAPEKSAPPPAAR